MTVDDIEILIWATENKISVIEESFYNELVEKLKKTKRNDLLKRLLNITPYKKEA